MTGAFSLMTLQACQAGAKELGVPMHVTVQPPVNTPGMSSVFTGAVTGIGSKLGVRTVDGLIEDVPPAWVISISVAPSTLKLDKDTDSSPVPSPITVEYLRQRYNHGYATAIVCAAGFYRSLAEAGGNGDPFWTNQAEVDLRQRYRLDGAVSAALLILKTLPPKVKPNTALQMVKDHIRDIAAELACDKSD